MSNVIQLKRSSTPGSIPDSANLAIGEPAVNLVDQVLYTKDASGTVKVIGAGTTSNIAEGENLYFTNTRVYANVELIGYASNAYVETRLETKANTADLNTSNVVEGSNLYFTNTRAIYAFTGGEGISIASNGLLTASVESTQVESGGFVNSTVVIFPGSTGNKDYGENETGISNTRDAFGVSLIPIYDCMEPLGRVVSGIDFGALA